MDDITTEGGNDRRTFLKRMAAVGFVVPVVTTFGTAGVQSSFAQSASSSGVSAPTTTTDVGSGGGAATTTTSTTTSTMPPTTTTSTTTTSMQFG